MTKKETKQYIAVMQAYVDGKNIEIFDESADEWLDIEYPLWNWYKNAYRIKPESYYRPFRGDDECWKEMLKHQPFGVVLHKRDMAYIAFECLDNGICNFNGYREESFESAFDDIQFADGSPFGVKVEQ